MVIQMVSKHATQFQKKSLATRNLLFYYYLNYAPNLLNHPVKPIFDSVFVQKSMLVAKSHFGHSVEVVLSLVSLL